MHRSDTLQSRGFLSRTGRALHQQQLMKLRISRRTYYIINRYRETAPAPRWGLPHKWQNSKKAASARTHPLASDPLYNQAAFWWSTKLNNAWTVMVDWCANGLDFWTECRPYSYLRRLPLVSCIAIHLFVKFSKVLLRGLNALNSYAFSYKCWIDTMRHTSTH